MKDERLDDSVQSAVDVAALDAAVHVLTVTMTSQLTSSVAATTHLPPLPASPRTRLSWTNLHNGVYRPTATASTAAQLSATVLQSGAVTNSKEATAELVSVWVAVGVGIAALVIVLAVAILVSLLLSLLCALVWPVVF